MRSRCFLALALLGIGIAPARANYLTGDIAVYNAAGTTLLGYVSNVYDGQNSFTYSASIGNALSVEISSPPSGPFSILEPAPPLSSANGLQPLSYNAPGQSTIWSNTGQILTPGWVNSNGSTSTDVVFYDPVVNYLGITGNLADYNSTYSDGAVAVTLEFTAFSSSSTSAPEPASGALAGIALAVIGFVRYRRS